MATYDAQGATAYEIPYPVANQQIKFQRHLRELAEGVEDFANRFIRTRTYHGQLVRNTMTNTPNRTFPGYIEVKLPKADILSPTGAPVVFVSECSTNQPNSGSPDTFHETFVLPQPSPGADWIVWVYVYWPEWNSAVHGMHGRIEVGPWDGAPDPNTNRDPTPRATVKKLDVIWIGH